MSRAGSPKKSQNNSNSFLAQTNPEIFTMKGRPGGCIPIKKIETVGRISNIPVEDKVSREFRLQTALDEKPSIMLEEDEVDLPNPLHDSIYMLSVAMSTVVLLSAGFKDIPDDNIEWTRKYLRCIKDEYGIIPPNVRGILNEIEARSPSPSGEEAYEKPKTIRTTTRVSVG